jgi:hypothetical protein
MRAFVLTIVAALLGLTALTGAGTSAAMADPLRDTLTVRIEPTTASLKLGDHLDLHITVSNHGPNPSPPLVMHLDVTDPNRTTSVDPEDWTSTLSKPVGVVAPGGVKRIDWNVQPFSGGTFAAYAVALSPGLDSLASSNVVQVQVAEQRALNPGGILAAAIGMPALVGSLLILQRRAAQRTRVRPTAPNG